ncbi:MAG: helix-turn-helix domain-containing protein [Kiritimatiellae bacterium]|nr:helix-turn-helix domain-containing protein [Kiritimatiellia bacterium]
MNTPIEFQTIEHDGKPAFAVVPYDEFVRLIEPESTIPHDVVGLVIEKGYSLVRAWREHRGLTQVEVAKRMGITQAALSQIEDPASKPRKQTFVKLAKVLGLRPEQVRE